MTINDTVLREVAEAIAIAGTGHLPSDYIKSLKREAEDGIWDAEAQAAIEAYDRVKPQPRKMTVEEVDKALRYLFQVGYNVAHADCTLRKPYNADAGANYSIYETREPEASTLRALAKLGAIEVVEG